MKIKLKKIISKIIRKNPHVYRMAKRIYRLFHRNVRKKFILDSTIYIGYLLDNVNELEKIKIHFQNLNVAYSKILLIIDGYDIDVNALMPEYSVISIQYFKKYYKKLNPHNIFIYDYKNHQFNQLFKNIL